MEKSVQLYNDLMQLQNLSIHSELIALKNKLTESISTWVVGDHSTASTQCHND